jgi:hypothetical protein
VTETPKDPVEQVLHDRVLRILREIQECAETERHHQAAVDSASRKRVELEVERSALEKHMRERDWEVPNLVRQTPHGMTVVDPSAPRTLINSGYDMGGHSPDPRASAQMEA